MNIDLSTLSPSQVYFTMIQAVVPRPIAWVLSDNGDNSFNLAPFSYFNAVGSEPPMIALSISDRPEGGAKDTLRNICRNKRFVVHIAHVGMVEALNESSRGLPFGESEVTRLGLELTTFEGVEMPRLAVCRVALACELSSVQQIGPTQHLVLATVSHLYICDDVCTTDAKGRQKIHADRIDPLARLGADEYAALGNIISLRRPL